MKKVINLGFVLILLILFACHKEEDNFDSYVREMTISSEATVTVLSNSFEYNTTKSLELEVSFINSNSEALYDAFIEVYSENPENEDGSFRTDLIPCFKGITDAQGKIKTQFAVPSYVSQIYLCPQLIGIANKIEIPLTQRKNKVIISGSPQKSISDNYTEKSEILGMITLGTWNELGVPDYICGQDIISPTFLKKVTAALPERKYLPALHPEFFEDDVTTDIILKEKGEVYVTFLHEGAGNKNIFGYYTYEKGNAPKTVADIKNMTIIFPNSSFYNSGGGLYAGDKVCLGEFSKNTVIAWFVIANGWQNTVTNGINKFFSDKWLNPETDMKLKQHSVLSKDFDSKRYIIGFEDLSRQTSGCDNDFNDIVFYVAVTPETAVFDDDIEDIEPTPDSDGDGVSDNNDEYPNDKTMAFNNNTAWYSLVYEDLWPSQGDYDFNDMVLSYQINQISNANNLVVKIMSKFSIRAIGAGFHNGFAIEFPISPNNIEQVSGTVFTDSSYFKINANGTEIDQTNAVVPVFDDAYHAFYNKGMINVHVNQTFIQPDTFNVEIKFAVPQSFSSLGEVPYNPFIIKNRTRKIEIHLPNKMPTDLVDKTKFGTVDDNSDLLARRTYLTKDNKPWALNIAGEFYHPYEKINIQDAYLKYEQWATSNGNLFNDWYLNIEGYRDVTKIYPNP